MVHTPGYMNHSVFRFRSVGDAACTYKFAISFDFRYNFPPTKLFTMVIAWFFKRKSNWKTINLLRCVGIETGKRGFVWRAISSYSGCTPPVNHIYLFCVRSTKSHIMNGSDRNTCSTINLFLHFFSFSFFFFFIFFTYLILKSQTSSILTFSIKDALLSI